MGDCPVINAARPAGQFCWPHQSVNIAPSLAMWSMFGVNHAHHEAIPNEEIGSIPRLDHA